MSYDDVVEVLKLAKRRGLTVELLQRPDGKSQVDVTGIIPGEDAESNPARGFLARSVKDDLLEAARDARRQLEDSA